MKRNSQHTPVWDAFVAAHNYKCRSLISGRDSENAGIGVKTVLLLKKHTACLWQSSMGPLLKNTIFRQLNILKQGENTDVTESVSRLKQENGEFLQGVNYQFWLVI